MLWLASDTTAVRLCPDTLVLPGTALAMVRLDESDVAAADDLPRAVPVRRREYAAGRACARCAMEGLGEAPVHVGRNPDRSPAWPGGLVGTISHCRHYALAAVSLSLRSIGADVECLSRLQPRLYPLLFTAAEQRIAIDNPDAGTALFSAKEAVFKAIFPLAHTRPDFHDVEIVLDLEAGVFRSRFCGGESPARALVNLVEGHVAISGAHVLTLALLVA